MAPQQFWGVVFSDAGDNASLGGKSYSDLNYNHNLFWVDDPDHGEPNQIHPNQPDEGISFSEDEPPQVIVEMGVFSDVRFQMADGRTEYAAVYVFRLADGRTVLRVNDDAMYFINERDYSRNDILRVDLSDQYDELLSIDFTQFDDEFDTICFANGTLIETVDGLVAVEDLRPGMLLRTADHGFQPLLLALLRGVDARMLARHEKLRPVRIMAGALGNGLPRRDLRVSRQHRMLVSSRIAGRMFGTSEVLVPAIRLTVLPGIFVEESPEALEYFHLVLDEHQILFAEGAASESLLIGPQALAAMTPEARVEILTLFPDAITHCHDVAPVRPVPPNARQKSLIARHAKHRKPVVEVGG
ncbi:Hint domain-containing protein [Paracoccus alcaliphilus]|uniref:Hint domain-containing protein n=1 Tax=Paracoccus alcaliphilus TaxID=34002 RepID=A0A1H8PP01_9RHOB|nr:Hint domain-containing protein [Paracoccus alcaliphilus]WCR17479.1 Hint domain-containing protein [Paracoccus alcaliphilus]SEO43516.1 Hint domain-containing protein [Paracoccus alcaliphilus]